MREHVLLTMGFLMFLVQAVYAEISILSVQSPIIFGEDESLKTTSVSFTCSKSNATTTGAFVRFENFALTPAAYNGAYYYADITIFNLPSNYGNRSISIKCSYSDNTEEWYTTSIIVDKVALSITNPTFNNPVEVFKGEYITSLRVEMLSSYITPDIYSLSNIEAYLKSYNKTYKLEDILISYEGNALNLFVYVPYQIKEGTYDLEIKATYTYGTSTYYLSAKSQRSVIVKSPISLKLIEPAQGEILKVSSTLTKKIRFKILEKGNEVLDITPSNIKFFIGNREIPHTTQYDNDKGEYVSVVEIIKPLNHDKTQEALVLTISNYKNYPPLTFEIGEVEYVVMLTGKTITKGGKIINTKFVFDNGKNIYTFQSNNKGEYNILIPKGTYNLTLTLNNVDKITLWNVKIKESLNNFIKVNYPSYTSEEFRIIKALVLEISTQYEKAKAEIYYDDTKIKDERNIIAFYCTYWNFGLETCNGALEKYQYRTNIISNTVEIDNFQGNALIAEKKRLIASIETQPEEYFVGEEVKIIGFVKDVDGNAQKGIEIRYAVKGTGIEGKTTTDANGKFTISFLAPKVKSRIEEKELVVYINSDKIESNNATYKFTVEKRVKLVGYVDEIIQVKKGIETPITIEIANEGDLELTDIEIRVSGLKEDWYVFTPSFIETLKPGDKTEVKMNVKITCNQDCKEYYFVNMRIKSREATEDISFTIRVLDNTTKSTNITTSRQEKASSNSITGKIINIDFSSPSKINTYIIIGFFIAAFIIITIKKRYKKSGIYPRRMFLLRKRI